MRSTIWRHLDERGECDGHYGKIVDPPDITNIMYQKTPYVEDFEGFALLAPCEEINTQAENTFWSIFLADLRLLILMLAGLYQSSPSALLNFAYGS